MSTLAIALPSQLSKRFCQARRLSYKKDECGDSRIPTKAFAIARLLALELGSNSAVDFLQTSNPVYGKPCTSKYLARLLHFFRPSLLHFDMK